MAKIIPQNNTLIQQKGLGDTFGDIIESFNLDLNSNYGAIRNTGMKLVTTSTDETDMKTIGAFAKYNSTYYGVSDDFVYSGEQAPSDAFSKVTASNSPNGETSSFRSDMKVFNECLYVSGSNEVFKLDLATWSTPITTGLDTSPHLLENYANKLYITNNNTQVLSISTADALATSGTGTLDLGLDNSIWSITMLKASMDSLWIGLLNTVNGKGRVYQWDGETVNTPTKFIELDSGVAAGNVLDNIPYIIDFNGVVRAYNGSSFPEVARLYKKKLQLFDGSITQNNLRFISPNGMVVTPKGTILFLISNYLYDNGTSNIYEDTIPSGIYEYDPNIGIYHKYSPSYSAVGTTTVTDYGQQRISPNGTTAGALFYTNQETDSLTDNGFMLASMRYESNASEGEIYGIFCDDSLDTTQKWGYFVTNKIFSSSVEDTWKKIYIIYEKLLNTTDKIFVKYRTKNDTPTEATITWTDTDTFTTTTDISEYLEGDEVQVVQGTGSGKSAHISSISESGGTYTVNLDDTFTGVTGTAKALLSKWIKAGEIDSTDPNNWKALTISEDNTNPYIQFKVCMQFTGKNEVYKARVISSSNVNE